MKKDIIDELNTFLKGNFIAIKAYERYMKNIDHPDIKRIFHSIQQNHIKHAEMITKRIEQLHGKPANSPEVIENIIDWMSSLKKETTDLAHIIKDAKSGEQRGIKKSQQLLEDDLDEESLHLVKRILKKDQEHIEQLSAILDSLHH